MTLLTAKGSNILLQNLTATNLRGPIVLNGAASMRDSTLSCDTTSGNVYTQGAILEVNGFGEKVSTTTVTNCKSGIHVAGTGNTLSDVAVSYDKAAAASADDGVTGVTLGSGNTLTASVLGKTAISGFTTALEMQPAARAANVITGGIVTMDAAAKLGASTITNTLHVNGSNVLITKSTLGGDPAVAIAKGLTGVTVTQNNFTNANTIAYVDPDDAKARTLLSVAWMGKKKSEVDQNFATRIIGKLLEQTNVSKFVEMNTALLKDAVQVSWLSYNYDHTCAVASAPEDIPLAFKSKDGADTKTIVINKGELYFDCAYEADGKTPLNIPLTAKARFVSNTPTVSTMSEDVTVADLDDFTIIAIAQPSLPIGSELVASKQGDTTGSGGSFNAPKVPEPADVGDNANTGKQDNNATGDAMTLGGEAPGVIASGADGAGVTGLAGSLASGKGCSLVPVGIDHSQAASALIWLIALLPLPLLVPYRRSRNGK